MDTVLELRNITKSFGKTEVLRNISIKIGKGEFITLLGPSGCGKTTILRIIAGLEEPDGGRVFLNGIDVTGTEPNKRDVNTVFQNYALFPHMNVEDNIAYGLRIRKTDKKEIAERVSWALELVQLAGYNKRYPNELSGGQKQRVAIARAIVNNPKVLLLDEPLGALDLQLRKQMQMELKRLQKKLGITFVYITHDQEEAINMSDRIAVIREGAFEQIGTPAQVYDLPKTSYVAEFVGNANLLHGRTVEVKNGVASIEVAGGLVKAALRDKQPVPGMEVTLAVRSENVRLYKDRTETGIKCRLKEVSFAGGMQKIFLQLADGTEVVYSSLGMNSAFEPDSELYMSFDAGHGVLVDL